MFIRWKKRQLKEKDRSEPIGWYWSQDKQANEWFGQHRMPVYGWKDTDDYSLGAYLVESYRNEEGKPRQRNVAYLGSVRYEVRKDFEPTGRYWLWKKFYEVVDQHGIQDKEPKLADKIADKIGMMTRAGVEQLERLAAFERAIEENHR